MVFIVITIKGRFITNRAAVANRGNYYESVHNNAN